MQKELQELEKQRKGVMAWDIVLKVLFGISVVLGVIVAVKDERPEGFLIGLVLVLILLLALALIEQVFGFGRKRKAYALHYKRLFVEKGLKNVFSDVWYYEDGEIEQEKIASTEMIKMGNRYWGEDYISGRYKGVSFEQAELRIQNVSRGRRHTSTTTYFKGRWMIFEFPKPFASELQVKERGFAYAKKSGGWFSRREKMRSKKMDDLEFNQRFQVNAVDEQEADSLLTFRTMESMKWLEKQTNGKLMFCFVDGQLHVAISSCKNAFEPPIYEKIDPERAMRAIEEDIQVITRFVDELQLNSGMLR